MKRSFLALGLLSMLFACKKNNDDDNGNTPTGPAISAADVAHDYAPNKTVYYYSVNGNGGGVLTVPSAGTGQTWNFGSLSQALRDTVVLGPAGNNGFPTATFSSTEQRIYGGGGTMQTINITNYGEVSANGWMQVGHALPAFTLAYPGIGTLEYDAQNALYTPTRLPMTPPFPVHLNDEVNFNTVITEHSTADAPSAGLSNAPTAQKTTYTGKVKAIATGTITLPGYAAPMNVMVLRRDLTTVDNFLLNGVTPPAPLLAALGIVDGGTYTASYYDFYNYNGIGYLGTIVVQSGTIAYGRFRRAD